MNGNSKSLGYMLVLLGIVLAALSYMFVYKKTNQKIDEIETEISTLKTRQKQLKRLEADRENMLKSKAEAEEDYEELIKGFDGDITYQSEIMDAYEMTQEFEVEITRLALTPFTEVYSFGAVPSSNPNGGTGGANPDYIGKMESYNMSAEADYDTTKEILEYFIEGKAPYREDGKRKVITSVALTPNKVEQSVAIELSINEYAIVGDDREMAEVPEYEYPTSTPNIFWGDEIIAQ